MIRTFEDVVPMNYTLHDFIEQKQAKWNMYALVFELPLVFVSSVTIGAHTDVHGRSLAMLLGAVNFILQNQAVFLVMTRTVDAPLFL